LIRATKLRRDNSKVHHQHQEQLVEEEGDEGEAEQDGEG